MSDTDSDATIEPDPKEWEEDARKSIECMGQKQLSKRHSKIHDISDSEDEEVKYEKHAQKKNNDRNSPSLFDRRKERQQKVNNSSDFSPHLKNSSDFSPQLKKISSCPLASLKESPSRDFSSLKRRATDSSQNSAKPSEDKKETQDKKTLSFRQDGSEQASCSHHLKGYLKRKHISKSTKPKCQYGSKCYRKNPAHFMEYSHPG